MSKAEELDSRNAGLHRLLEIDAELECAIPRTEFDALWDERQCIVEALALHGVHAWEYGDDPWVNW